MLKLYIPLGTNISLFWLDYWLDLAKLLFNRKIIYLLILKQMIDFQ